MPVNLPLQRLLDLLGPTLPMYLADAGLSTFPGPEPVRLAIAALVDDQRSLIERAGTALDAAGGAAPRRGYPIRYSGMHDVDLGFLVPQLVESADGQALALESLLGELPAGAGADLVRDALQSARFHADALRQLASAARPAAVPAV